MIVIGLDTPEPADPTPHERPSWTSKGLFARAGAVVPHLTAGHAVVQRIFAAGRQTARHLASVQRSISRKVRPFFEGLRIRFESLAKGRSPESYFSIGICSRFARSSRSFLQTSRSLHSNLASSSFTAILYELSAASVRAASWSPKQFRQKGENGHAVHRKRVPTWLWPLTHSYDHSSKMGASFSLRMPQRNRNEMGETTVNRT